MPNPFPQTFIQGFSSPLSTISNVKTMVSIFYAALYPEPVSEHFDI
jgi:hypothetical protein